MHHDPTNTLAIALMSDVSRPARTLRIGDPFGQVDTPRSTALPLPRRFSPQQRASVRFERLPGERTDHQFAASDASAAARLPHLRAWTKTQVIDADGDAHGLVDTTGHSITYVATRRATALLTSKAMLRQANIGSCLGGERVAATIKQRPGAVYVIGPKADWLRGLSCRSPASRVLFSVRAAAR
jgi:hypothetical protein